MSIDQTVTEAKRIGVFECWMDCKLSHAAEVMLQEDISALVVTREDGSLAGIITRVDLLRAWMNSPNWKAEKVSQYMSPEVVTVDETVRLAEVVEILLHHHIHRVVVVRNEEEKVRPIAVVSAADLIYHMMSDS